MVNVNVQCVEVKDGRIVSIGGSADGGWLLSAAVAIQRIKSGVEAYHTLVGGLRAEIGVNGAAPNEFLQTHRDGTWINNLGALPACPVTYRKIAQPWPPHQAQKCPSSGTR